MRGVGRVDDETNRSCEVKACFRMDLVAKDR